MADISKVKWSVAKLCEILPYTKATINKAIRDIDLQPAGRYRGQNPYDYYDPKAVIKAIVESQVQKGLDKAKKSKPAKLSSSGSAETDGDLMHRKTLHEAEKYEAQKFRNQLRAGELIPADTVESDLRDLFGELSSIIDGTGHKLKSLTKEPKMLSAVEKWVNQGKRALANFRITQKAPMEASNV